MEGVTIGGTTDGKVLVVDPDPAAVAALERRLRPAGFDFRAATTAREALDRATRDPPDVVLLALALPDADGFAALGRLRAAPALAGVSIALSAAARRDPESVRRGLELGADDYLRDDVDAVELVARVRVLVRLRRQIAELAGKNARLGELNAELQRLAVRDPLTNAYNRGHLERRLAEEVARAVRYGQDLSLVVADVDHFKRVNDSHGHLAGDGVLRGVASLIQRTIRKVDLLARYGGEEFVVVAPCTDAAGARALAERIRAAVAEAPLIASTGSGVHMSLRVTASFGVATLHGREGQGAGDPEALVAAADAALYRAKRSGRNRVEAAEAA